ncbi:MAG: EAL domain-containing protein, partial [Acidimicrobiales bacterium]|nr:EAL domain-containing protein [Acidimicrobiales bacterium]
ADLAMYARKQQRAAALRAEREGREAEPPSIVPPYPAVRVPEGPSERRSDPIALDLARAIDDDGLHLVHQPLVGRDGTIAGIEALIRWDHPVLGEVGPERILAIADNDDLAGPLGRWVRRRALTERRRWLGLLPGTSTVPVHVNLSPRELALPSFTESVLSDLDEVGVDPDALVLEVRERYLADPLLRDVVGSLTRVGFEVLVENAGQGGVSLAELAGLSVGGLKLGRALVSQIHEQDPMSIEVARSLVLLAHGLGWRSLAIGVETDHQQAVLFGFGLDAVQGDVITMPLGAERLAAWLSSRHGG